MEEYLHVLLVAAFCLTAAGSSEIPRSHRARLFERTSSPQDAPRSVAGAGARVPSIASAFVANLGQWPESVRFVANLGATSAIVHDWGWWLVLTQSPGATNPNDAGSAPAALRGAALRMSFVDAGAASVFGEDLQTGVHNYLIGRDRSRWRTDVPRYGAVRLCEPYPGIDVRLYEISGHFEYDLLVSPGADMGRLAIRVAGTDRIELAGDGALVMHTAVGEVRQPAPLAFTTDASGRRDAVACSFVLMGPDCYGFAVPGREIGEDLCIDPGLVYSTFAGGSNGAVAYATSVSDDGLVTVAGATPSPDFPTTAGAWSRSFRGSLDALVFRLDPSQPPAGQLRYATFLGGVSAESASGMSIDAAGVVTICGTTDSTDFPTTANAFAAAYGGGTWPCYGGDAFVARLDPSRQGVEQLVYATYLGGSGCELAHALAVDASQAIVLTGSTTSLDYPTTTGAADRVFGGGVSDVFVARLDPARAGNEQLTYSTYVGGRYADWAYGLVLCRAGLVTIAGFTHSDDYPTTTNAWRRTLSGGVDINLTRIDPHRSGPASLDYSTFFGGSGTERAFGLHLGDDVLTITGSADSQDFPVTPDGYEIRRTGGDLFVAQLDFRQPAARQLLYSTRFGGYRDDIGRAVDVDASGSITVVGEVWTDWQPIFFNEFPTTPGALSRRHAGGIDGFVARLDPSRRGAQQLSYSTLLGGAGTDVVAALALDRRGGAVVVGTTNSANFPVTGDGWDTAYSGGPYDDAFVAVLDLLPTGVHRVGTSSPGCAGPLAIGVSSIPSIGSSQFALTCSHAPPQTIGEVLIGQNVRSHPIRAVGVDVWIDPLLALPARSEANGSARVVLPIPYDPDLIGGALSAQFCWVDRTDPPPCPPQGFSTSNALRIEVQPPAVR